MSYIIKGYLCNYGFCIKKKNIDDKIIKILTEYFCVKPELNYDDENKGEENKYFDVYYQDENYIVLPKFSTNINININIIINDIEYSKILFFVKKIKYKKSSTNFNFIGKLRDYQETIINEIFNKFGMNINNLQNKDNENKSPKGGIIKLSCGGGKTVLAIYLSWILKLKTLIVVHKEFLMDQWIERFSQYTDAKIGIIRQKKVDIEGKDIVIAMLRSLSIKEYSKEIFEQFGLVIYDEVHHLGSRVDSQALLKTSAEYTIGLSATPERSDGLIKIINWHVGDILYEMEKKYNYRVLVKKIYFTSEDKLFKEKKRWFNGRMAPNHIEMTDAITNIKSRNQLICNFIDIIKSMGRKILILSYRVEHLESLKEMVDEKIKSNGESHIYNTYYYMGKTKKGEKKMAEKDGDIIFATMQLAEEGLDISHLDTILFALPVSIQMDKKKAGKIKSSKTLIQSIGRILRNDKLEQLTQIPMVIDISDLFSIYSTWSNKRNDVYGEKNWYLQNYYWNDLNYIYKAGQDKNINPMNIIFNDISDEDFIEKNLLITEEQMKLLDNSDDKKLKKNEPEKKYTSYAFGKKKIIK